MFNSYKADDKACALFDKLYPNSLTEENLPGTIGTLNGMREQRAAGEPLNDGAITDEQRSDWDKLVAQIDADIEASKVEAGETPAETETPSGDEAPAETPESETPAGDDVA